MTHIYSLVDPETDEIKYIGQTTNVRDRYRSHLSCNSNSNPGKNNWILSLKNKGLVPIMEIIESCEDIFALKRETYNIRMAMKSGAVLLNNNKQRYDSESSTSISLDLKNEIHYLFDDIAYETGESKYNLMVKALTDFAFSKIPVTNQILNK